MKLQEFVKIADTVYEVDAAALCDEDRLKYSRVVDFKVCEAHFFLYFLQLTPGCKSKLVRIVMVELSTGQLSHHGVKALKYY